MTSTNVSFMLNASARGPASILNCGGGHLGASGTRGINPVQVCQREEAEMNWEGGVNVQSQEEMDTKGIQSTDRESVWMVGRMDGEKS